MKKLILLIAFALLLPLCACGEEFADFSQLYPDKFLPEGSEPIRTENSYQSDDVYLTITGMREQQSDIYVVDIYVRSVECFQRAFADGKWGSTTARVRTIAEENNAIIAMTGDSGHYFSFGWVAANGQVLRDNRNRMRDLGIVYRSGELVTVENENIDNDLIRSQTDDIWHIFLFGPALLDENGKAKTDFSDSNVESPNPRSLIGYYAPGHYCFVQVDGRGASSKLDKGKTSRGLDLENLALFMEGLGCKSAYNLDGGQSSMLVYNGEIYSSPYHGGRNVGDVVLIKDLP